MFDMPILTCYNTQLKQVLYWLLLYFVVIYFDVIGVMCFYLNKHGENELIACDCCRFVFFLLCAL